MSWVGAQSGSEAGGAKREWTLSSQQVGGVP